MTDPKTNRLRVGCLIAALVLGVFGCSPAPADADLQTPKGIPADGFSETAADDGYVPNPQLSNFREITTTGIAPGRLYRTATPVDPLQGRNRAADEACRHAGVTVIINLADSEKKLLSHEGYADTYYATVTHFAVPCNFDFTSAETEQKFASAFRFMAETPGVYAIHCIEGKDRTGFASAILECLMGASFGEVAADYMLTYENYYGIVRGDDRYDEILYGNLVETLEDAFDVPELEDADLAAEADAYLMEIGLTEAEIIALKANLAS